MPETISATELHHSKGHYYGGADPAAASGVGGSDAAPRATASALGAMVESFAHLWQDPVERLDEPAAVDVLTRLWAGGIELAPPAWPWVTVRAQRPPRRSTSE